MSESLPTYVKFHRGEIAERVPTTPAEEVNLKATGWAMKGSTLAKRLTGKASTKPLEGAPATSAAAYVALAGGQDPDAAGTATASTGTPQLTNVPPSGSATTKSPPSPKP